MPRKPDKADVVLAAGGIVWRDAERGREYAVIHRPRHEDWTLPKGKLDRKERWQDAALREVEEETGFRIELGAFAGSCSYMTRSAPKVVLYWFMHPTDATRFRPHDPTEVDQLEWLTFEEASARLTYDRERRVLAEAHTGVMPMDEEEETASTASLVLDSTAASRNLFIRLRQHFRARHR